MKDVMQNIKEGYRKFRAKYAAKDHSLMEKLGVEGQHPEIMIVGCSDSRVDPALILQCDPGDLFVVRNVANIVPKYAIDESHHGTCAALEFGICYLEVKNLVLFGHSQCGGINALIAKDSLHQDDFISNWVANAKEAKISQDPDIVAKQSLKQSRKNCLEFPWIKQRVDEGKLQLDLWFFDIRKGQLEIFDEKSHEFLPYT